MQAQSLIHLVISKVADSTHRPATLFICEKFHGGEDSAWYIVSILQLFKEVNWMMLPLNLLLGY